MPNIIDVVASRVSRDLTRQKLTQTFRERPTTAKGLVLGKQLAQINGTPTATALDDEDLVQTVVEFTNIGRPSMAVWATGGGSGSVQTSATTATGVSNPYVPTTRRISTIFPIQGGADLGSGDLTLSLAEHSVTAEALAAVITDSDTIDVEIAGETIQFNVKPGAIDADTLDGYHASDIMAAINSLPDGIDTGDIVRWDATAEEWVVAQEPFTLAGLILTPMTDLPATEGAMYYDALTGHILVYTDA